MRGFVDLSMLRPPCRWLWDNLWFRRGSADEHVAIDLQHRRRWAQAIAARRRAKGVKGARVIHCIPRTSSGAYLFGAAEKVPRRDFAPRSRISGEPRSFRCTSGPIACLTRRARRLGGSRSAGPGPSTTSAFDASIVAVHGSSIPAVAITRACCTSSSGGGSPSENTRSLLRVGVLRDGEGDGGPTPVLTHSARSPHVPGPATSALEPPGARDLRPTCGARGGCAVDCHDR